MPALLLSRVQRTTLTWFLWAIAVAAALASGYAVAALAGPRAQGPKETIEGKVVAVADGDTVTVLVDRVQVKVRLWGIDAPEKAQAFGQRSREHVSSLVFGRQVRVEVWGRDRYDRTLGRIYVDATDVNLQMVRAGMAWWYQKYSPKAQDIEVAEQQARSAKLGLWRDVDPQPPWEFRKAKRAGQPAP
jgi:micrococcal nuclease